MSMKSSTYGSRCHGEYFGCMSSPKNVLIEGLEIYETPTKWATGGTHSPWQLISGAGNVDKKQSDSTNWGWYWAVSCLFRLVYQGVCITLQAVRMKKVNKFGGTPKSDKAPQILGKQTTRDQLSCAGREYYIYICHIYIWLIVQVTRYGFLSKQTLFWVIHAVVGGVCPVLFGHVASHVSKSIGFDKVHPSRGRTKNTHLCLYQKLILRFWK